MLTELRETLEESSSEPGKSNMQKLKVELYEDDLRALEIFKDDFNTTEVDDVVRGLIRMWSPYSSFVDARRSGLLGFTKHPMLYIPTTEDKETILDINIKIPLKLKKVIDQILLSHKLGGIEELLEKMVRSEVIETIDDVTLVNLSTLANLIPTWTLQLVDNLKYTLKMGKDITELDNFYRNHKSRRGICIGAGPSLFRRDHLNRLAEYMEAADPENMPIIFAADHIIDECIKSGIVPDVICTIDCNEKVFPFYNTKAVKKHLKDMKVILSTYTNTKVVKLVANHCRDIYWLTPEIGDFHAPNVKNIFNIILKGKYSTVITGGCVGNFIWNVAMFMGCDEIALIGYDCGYPRDMPINETIYYTHFMNSWKGDMEKVEGSYIKHPHECYGKDFVAYTDIVFEGYMEAFLSMLYACGNQVRTFNCTEGGVLCASKYPKYVNMECINLDAFLMHNY